MRVLAEIGARGVDGQRPVTLARLVSQAVWPMGKTCDLVADRA